MIWPCDFVDKLICSDCLGAMPDIPDQSVDLVFADPPFNVGKAYSDSRSDYRTWCSRWIAECFRVLRDTGSFYCMTLCRHLEWQLPIMAQHGIFINLISWRNVSAAHDRRRFWNEYQPIMLYGKSAHYKFNRYAEIEDSGQRRWGGYSTEYRGQLKDRWSDIPFVYAGSISHQEAVLKPGTNSKAHPCQMPEGIAARAIRFSTDEGDLVLDPFVGSGTTAVVAKKLGRRFVGIELEPRFIRIAEDRFAADLFL